MKFSLALLATATSTGLASASADQILAFPPQRNLRSLSEGELGFSPDFLIDAYKKNAFNWEGIKTFLNGICEYYDNKPCWPEQETRRLLNEGKDMTFDDAKFLQTWPPAEDKLPSVADLDNFMNTGIWDKVEIRDDVNNRDLSVQYVKFECPMCTKGALVVTPGQSESIMKYKEILYSFRIQGFSPIFCIDHVGQGSSDRVNQNDHFMQHVEKKEHLINAYETFLNTILPSIPASKPRFLACHSMGCALSFAVLINDYEAQRATKFNAVVANAPLVKADTSPFPYPVATAIGKVMVGVGKGTSYAPTKEYTFAESFSNSAFSESTSTSSPERWLRYRNDCLAAKDKTFGHDQHKGKCLGGLSAQFAKEFFDLYNKLYAFREGKGMISTPILIQIASAEKKSDGLVLNAETAKFCDGAMQNCIRTNKQGARHNIWWERDSIRNNALSEASAFLTRHGGSKKAQCPLPHKCGEWDYWGFRCKWSSACSYQYRAWDWHLGMSCRPRTDAC